ncbi:hypothetical protein H257_14918 [Aphanomyces astaci]|uniref:Uncharacterized protein n=1 Tax=Aphanomyces astaci TaxID=112090 RepID=W4FQR5_APHAT|nr:hypothetical protein H257_14918 [Aphanomyces astaci]ETV69291.1 hypothetical protein H257_14918 [Aphanomyces astaci]|eukprot:XP_009841148.1 hypothetical protein H257_14918 [Aphanomyces astaci]
MSAVDDVFDDLYLRKPTPEDMGRILRVNIIRGMPGMFVKLRRKRSLSYDEKLDILWFQATLREQGNLDGTGANVRLLGRAKKTVQGVLAEFNTLGDLSVAEPPSNTTNHRTTVPNTRAVRDLVRTFIRDRSVTPTRTVGKDESRLQEHNVVSVDASCKKSYGPCLRAVQLYLAKQEYARGKRVDATEYCK